MKPATTIGTARGIPATKAYHSTIPDVTMASPSVRSNGTADSSGDAFQLPASTKAASATAASHGSAGRAVSPSARPAGPAPPDRARAPGNAPALTPLGYSGGLPRRPPRTTKNVGGTDGDG